MTKKNTISSLTHDRVESLDVLRGFDLFCIVALEGILHSLWQAADSPWLNAIRPYFTHVSWKGLSPWDLIMPLFLFMAGVSIPFSLSRYKVKPNKAAVYRKIAKRVTILWIFGMICQGNLLGLDPRHIYLFSNTLQAIAVGYLIAAMLFLHVSIRKQIAATIILLLSFWATMQFVSIDGYGGGNYSPDGNLAEWIDRTILGRFRDGATVTNGTVVFAEYYRYTWILSSLNFGATVLTGVFAGSILKSDISPKRKWTYLAGIGIALIALGCIWSLQHPIIKRIWSSSMVLVSSGCCFILMGLFYFWIDYRKKGKYLAWLKVYGMNSITAYMLASAVSFRSISTSLLYGLEPYTGDYYPVLIATSNALIIYLILWFLHKHNIFLRV